MNNNNNNYDYDIEQALENLRRLGINTNELEVDPLELLHKTPTPVETKNSSPIILEPDQYEDVSSYTNPEQQAASEDFDGLSLLDDEKEEEVSEPVQGDENIEQDSETEEEDLNFESLSLLAEEDNNEMTFDESIALGDVVTLNSEIAELLDDYDPQDIFRIEAIDGAIATLSQNGKTRSELTAIPLNQLNKINEADYNDHLGIDPTKDEKKPVIEYGAKPIRWSKRFIERIRKNTSVDEISKKLEASQKKDEEENNKKKLPEGTLVSFKTSFLSNSLRIAKAASNQWNKIKKHREKSSEVQKDDIDTKKNPVSQSNTSGVNEVVEWFMNQSKDEQKNVLTDLIEQLNAAKQELTEATAALANANNQIESLSKGQTTDNEKTDQDNEALLARIAELEAENTQIKKDNQQLSEENEQLRNKPGDNNKDNGALLTNIVKLDTENTPVVNDKQHEHVKKHPKRIKAFMKTNGGLSDAGNYGLNHAQELSEENAQLRNGISNEQQTDQVNSDPNTVETTYDRSSNFDKFKEEDIKFWNEAGHVLNNPAYIEAANRSATEHINQEREDYQKLLAEENEKRRSIIEDSRNKALLNRLKGNMILGNITPDVLDNLNEVLDDTNNKSKSRR